MAKLMTTSTFQCLSCLGTYVDVQRDGSLYFHACPPLPANKDGVEVERADKRDENIVVNASGRVTGIQAEGQGVVCITNDKLPEPVWLTQLQARVDRDD